MDTVDMIGIGDEKPRDTSATHCSPAVLLTTIEQAALRRALMRSVTVLDTANAAMRSAAEARAGAFEQLDAAIDAMQPKCGYCGKPDAGWLPGDLQRGRRERPGVLEFHCYTAKVMD